jgi:hypothetical protein
MTLRYRDLEHSRVHAGLGVRLIDEYTQKPPIGWTRVYLDVADGGAWRELSPEIVRRTTTSGGVVWFPWLERYRDAAGHAPGKYRVRVAAELAAPAYLSDGDGVEVLVAPYDDAAPPVGTPPIVEIALLPAANYPFGPGVPVLHGAVEDHLGERVPRARVGWGDPGGGTALVTDEVLSDADGEFCLPMRRAPRATPIEITAQRPAPPAAGKHGSASVRLPDDLSRFLTIQIL